MDQKQVQAFATRVTQANRSELTLILYEIVLSDIESSKESFQKDDIAGFVSVCE